MVDSWRRVGPSPPPHRTTATLTRMSDRDRLRELIRDKAFIRGDFILSSGKRADWYLDLRRINLDGEAAPLVGRVMREATRELEYDAVGGLTLGADPVAGAMMHAAAAAGERLDAFVVRKEGKAHGMQRRIEGPDVKGRKVLAVEDTSTRGASVMQAVAALRDEGADVVGVAVIVDRGARAHIEAQGLRYFAAFDLPELDLGESTIGRTTIPRR